VVPASTPMPGVAGIPTWRDDCERGWHLLSSRHLLVRVHRAKRKIPTRTDPRGNDAGGRGTEEGGRLAGSRWVIVDGAMAGGNPERGPRACGRQTSPWVMGDTGPMKAGDPGHYAGHMESEDRADPGAGPCRWTASRSNSVMARAIPVAETRRRSQRWEVPVRAHQPTRCIRVRSVSVPRVKAS